MNKENYDSLTFGEMSTEYVKDYIKRHGQTEIVVVRRGEENAPLPGFMNLRNGRIYVLNTDWPEFSDRLNFKSRQPKKAVK